MKTARVVSVALAMVFALVNFASAAPSFAAKARETVVIPAIGVRAHVLQVGITNGAQAVTPSTTKVFHWRHGVVPGHRGSAVLAGHTCTFTCKHAVFNGLKRLHRGNLVRVIVGSQVVTFKVTSVHRHAHPGRRQVRSWYATTGHPRLVLVTCGDPANGEYHSRVVVRAGRI